MNRYRGRFAPSPTGPLHFGSLFAAVVSYLDARMHHGDWLLRIEDIDPPREYPNAIQMILDSLQAHGLKWDGPVVYQSDRSKLYDSTLITLAQKNLCYQCPCSRKQLADNHGLHLQVCIQQIKHRIRCACKFKTTDETFTWLDGIQGQLSYAIKEDFVLKRKDSLYAYQLAVVSDDIAQNITHVVRGSDLLDSTPMQLALYEGLGVTPPSFSHFPVIINHHHQKLSKQNLAPAVDNAMAIRNLMAIFQLLAITISPVPSSVTRAIELALDCWNPKNILKVKSIQLDKIPGNV